MLSISIIRMNNLLNYNININNYLLHWQYLQLFENIRPKIDNNGNNNKELFLLIYNVFRMT